MNDQPPNSELTLGVMVENGTPLIMKLAAHANIRIVPLCPDNMTATSRTKNRTAIDFANRLLTGGIDLATFMTAAGVETIFEEIAGSVDSQRFVDSLTDITTVAGSAAAAEALQAHGISASLLVDNTASWRELLMGVDRHFSVANQNVALEISADVHSLSAGFEARGAEVMRIPTFMFAFKGETEPANQFFAAAGMSQKEGARVGSPSRQLDAILFETAEDVALLEFVSAQHKIVNAFQRVGNSVTIVVTDSKATELFSNHNVNVQDLSQESDSNDPNNAQKIADLISNQLPSIVNENKKTNVTLSGPALSASDPNAPWYDSPFMRAARGEPTDVTPVWMMRQAGRYMQEYRDVRAKVSFLDLCANPQLCSEVMCTAVNKLGVDAAIIFSDLLPILVPMGCDLEFVKGDGPVIHNPIREASDIDRIKPLESNDPLDFVMETVRQTRNDLPADMPLIGFAGSPFTLASYMIEGGSSRNYHNTKRLMYTDAGAWAQLMDHLVTSITLYLNGQIAAGAQCVQLFDSWAGCLSYDDYKNYAHPYVQKIINGLPSNVPVINFATGNPALLPLLAETRAQVIGIDWRVRLDDAWQTVGYDRSVQGNLDPTMLLTSPKEIRAAVKYVLDQAAGRAGHIFNLGHGILPMTPVDNAIALVDAVHELSQR